MKDINVRKYQNSLIRYINSTYIFFYISPYNFYLFSLCLSIYLSLSLSVSLSSIYLYLFVYIYFSFINLSISLFLFLCISLSHSLINVYLSIYNPLALVLYIPRFLPNLPMVPNVLPPAGADWAESGGARRDWLGRLRSGPLPPPPPPPFPRP